MDQPCTSKGGKQLSMTPKAIAARARRAAESPEQHKARLQNENDRKKRKYEIPDGREKRLTAEREPLCRFAIKRDGPSSDGLYAS
jgi:hypothetical protein